MSPVRKYAVKQADGTVAWLRPEDIPNYQPPPPPSAVPTIFGYNVDDSEGPTKMARFGKLPLGVVYADGAVLNAATAFKPGGICYRGAGLGVAGLQSSQRVSISRSLNAAAVTGTSSAAYVEHRTFAANIPPNWHIRVVLVHHEGNLHLGSQYGNVTQFHDASILLAQALMDGDDGRGRVRPVINLAYTGGDYDPDMIAEAGDMPEGSELNFDYYDNSGGIGSEGGYHGYGAPYHGPGTASKGMAEFYATCVAKGYTAPGYFVGVREAMAFRRIAPKQPTLTGSGIVDNQSPPEALGWGPNSPADKSGKLGAASLASLAQFAIDHNFENFCLWTNSKNGNWNQSFGTAGAHDRDAAPGQSVSPQGWPITVDSSEYYAAYKHFVDISA